MKKYIVGIKEVHIQEYEIEAKNEQDAKERAGMEGELLEDCFEYSHSLESETWTVKEK